MPENRLASFLKVAGGLALAAPALSACDAICGACCAAKGCCAAYSEGAGCCAASKSRADMAEEAMADDAGEEYAGCCAAAE